MGKKSIVLATCIALGCAPPPTSGPLTSVSYEGAPKWVHKGSGAYDGPAGKAFYGVGIVNGIRNEALARQTCDNRARGEIAKIFDLYIAAMMKDYQRSTTAGDFKSSAEEQDVVSVQKTITEVSLRGIEIRDHWLNPQSGAWYALAVLDLNGIDQALGSARSLNARVRDHVRNNARRSFEDLDRELHKRNNPAPAATAPAPPRAPEPTPQDSPPAVVPVTPAAPPAAPTTRANVVGLRLAGNGAATVQTCLASRLISAGFSVQERSSDVDVMIQGSLSYAKAGYSLGSAMVRATLNLRLSNTATGKTLQAYSRTMKVGRPGLDQSIQLAISRFCDDVVPELAGKIGSALSR
jgi:hypothetical protein